MKNFISALAVYKKPSVLSIIVLGFFSGIPLSLTASTLTVWLAESGVSKAAIGLFAVIGTPYTLKFLWSPLMDNLKLGILNKILGRRRAWIVLTQGLLAASLFGLAFSNPSVNPFMTALWALLVAISSASQDIVIDAYRVERLEKDDVGAGAAAINFGYRMGMLFSGAGALVMAEFFSWKTTYFVMSAVFVMGIFITIKLQEPKFNEKKKTKESLAKFVRRAIVEPFANFIETHKNWLFILFFVVAYKLGDALAGMMTNPFLIETGFSKTQIAGIVKTYGLVATLLGAFIGGVIVKNYGMARSLLLCGILQMLSNLMFVLQAYVGNDPAVLTLVITVENLAGGMGSAAFVAYLSSLCNINFTATQYALLSSLAATGRTWLSASSGFIVESVGWVEFFLISTAAALPGILLIKFLKEK